jgi:D-alanyl-D-alanine carboxypeptidase (penicillin-binding protein 5/6)
MTLGATLATGMIFMMQSPLLHQSSTSTSLLSRLNVPAPTTIAWPEVGSAALVIPALGIERSHHNAVVPIASLTKLMTAYVTLQKLPLNPGEIGPCLRVNAADVAYYDTLVDSGQSSAAVAVGETLCENQLLAGLLVHSAGNFATMLANLAWGGTNVFVNHMNHQAHVLDLTGTHYVDVTGVGPQSVSTALDQGELAARLMQSAEVRAIVDQSSVTLPVAGTLGSYTPYVGLDNVVGVKSGRTDAAGGCDVMAMTFTVGGKTELAYAVVLGARGGDLLGPAGDEALALEQSVLRSEKSLWIPAGTVVGTLGWDNQRVNVVVKDHLELSWFTALHAANVRLHIDAETKPVKPGQVVGWLNVNEGDGYRVPLTVKRRVSALSLFQRLR